MIKYIILGILKHKNIFLVFYSSFLCKYINIYIDIIKCNPIIFIKKYGM